MQPRLNDGLSNHCELLQSPLATSRSCKESRVSYQDQGKTCICYESLADLPKILRVLEEKFS